MTSLFLPLRSNAAWFASEDHRAELERRLKNVAMVYDTLVVQDARYRRLVSEQGAFDVMMAPGSIADRSESRFIAAGTPFSISVSETGTSDWHPVVGGPALVNYEVDYYPIFNSAGLLSAPYLEWRQVDVDTELKGQAQRASRQLKASNEARAVLPDGHFLQDGIIEALYIDSLLGGIQALPICVDHHVARLVELGNSIATTGLEPDVRSLCHAAWVDLGVPDAGLWSWEQVHDARESAAGQEYRELIDRTGQYARELVAGGADGHEIRREMERILVRELIEEVYRRRTTTADAVINLGLNLLPAGGVISSAMDVSALVKEKRSWVTMLAPRQLPRIDVRE